MKGSGLTEKKMANKKFRATEEAIFVAYYKLVDYPSAKIIAKRAGISRSTLYRHHQLPRLISRDYEQYLLKIFSRKMQGFLNKEEVELKTMFLRVLIFIHNNRVTFAALFRDKHKDVIGKMWGKLKPRVLLEWHLAADTDKLFSVYQNEILGIIEVWSKDNFTVNNLDAVLSDIIYLTKTAPKRLVGIL